MKVMLNDLSFQYTMSSREEALERLRQFSYLCKMIQINIKSHFYTNLEMIETAPSGNYSWPIAPGENVYKLAQRIENKEQKHYLLSLLTNKGTDPDMQDAFILDQKQSYLLGRACREGGMVISLCSVPLFEQSELSGIYQEETHNLKNISRDQHCDEHWRTLGIRRYKPNSNKHKRDRMNNYGGSAPASPMDLSDEEAQNLLSNAIQVDGRLYGRKNDKNYAFMEEQPGVYHGYIAEDLPDHVIRVLNAHHKLWK